MKAIRAVFGLMTMLAGCVPPPQYGMAPSPPMQQTEKSDTGLPEQPEFKPMPATDVRRMKCSTLNSASDDDKAYASTFLLGYRSGMVHSHVLDTKQIDTVVQAAVAECAAKPEESAYKVFATAQIKAAMAERPPVRHALRYPLRTTPAAAPATPAPPSLSPPLQYAPSPVTPMETPSEKAATARPATPVAPTPPWATDSAAKPTSPEQPSPSTTPAQPSDQPTEKPAQPGKSAEAPAPNKPPETSPAAGTPSGDAPKP
jgi:hypothetical protein